MLNPNLQLHFVDNFQELQNFYEWLNRGPHPVMGIDTETTGLRIFQTTDETLHGGEPAFRCRMIQVGDRSAGWAFPCDEGINWSGPVLEMMEAYTGIWVAHNIAYDAKVLKKCYGFEFPWERTHDTMIMAQMLRPNESAALKRITKDLVDPAAAIMQDQLHKGMDYNDWSWATVPYGFAPYSIYSALDPVLAVELWYALRADLEEPISFDMEMSVLKLAIDAEYRGIRVDTEYCSRKTDELLDYVSRSKKWAEDNLKISITSTQQLSKWMQENGAELTQKTNSGAYKMDKDVLKTISKTGNSTVAPIADFVTNVKYQEKMANTYLGNFIIMSQGGYLHPQIKTMGAQTSGRMSITDPALQTLPKSDKMIRRAIIPDPGHILVSADEDQMELRIFSEISQDPHMVAMINDSDASGSDPFTTMAKKIYDEPDFQKSDPRRGLIKSAIYGKLFGAGPKKQAETAGVPTEQMEKINKDLEATYPGFIELPKRLEAETRLTIKDDWGFTQTVFTNRKVKVPADKLYRCVNYKIQASGSEMLKLNLIKLANAGYDQFFKLPIHDEVLLSIPPEIEPEVSEVLGDCMTTQGEHLVYRAAAEYKGTSWAGDIDKLDL